MSAVTVVRTTTAPVERVWDLATDIEGSPRVLSGVDAVELVGERSAFGVGTRWRETRTMLGRPATEEMWVTAVTPHESYTVESEAHGAHYVSTFTVTPVVEGGTEVALTFDGRPTTTVAKVLGAVTGPLARRSVAKALQGDLEDLCRAAERGQGA
ncbi:SRPBCC family protein [Thalassiella azotivora]